MFENTSLSDTSLQGSLRDMIHQVRPKASALVKYSVVKPITVAEKKCAVFCRQILEALLFLHEKGLGHGECWDVETVRCVLIQKSLICMVDSKFGAT